MIKKDWDNIPPKMSPNPLELILNQRDKIVNNINKYKKYGIINARKKSYVYI